MARIYANLIEKGLRTIDQVPARYKEPTLKILNEEGFDGYGKPL